MLISVFYEKSLSKSHHRVFSSQVSSAGSYIFNLSLGQLQDNPYVVEGLPERDSEDTGSIICYAVPHYKLR